MHFVILHSSMMKGINLKREALNATCGSAPGWDKS
jgi:hypothetical protein